MSDLISRQSALDAVHYYIESGYKCDIFQELKDLPSAEPDNQVHLCDSCHYDYPVCPAEESDVIFGNSIGHDNVCACAKFEIKPEQTAKVYQKQAPDKLYYFYCGNCGAKLDWSER